MRPQSSLTGQTETPWALAVLPLLVIMSTDGGYWWPPVITGLTGLVPAAGIVLCQRDLAGRSQPPWRGAGLVAGLLTIALALPVLAWADFWSGSWAT